MPGDPVELKGEVFAAGLNGEPGPVLGDPLELKDDEPAAVPLAVPVDDVDPAAEVAPLFAVPVVVCAVPVLVDEGLVAGVELEEGVPLEEVPLDDVPLAETPPVAPA